MSLLSFKRLTTLEFSVKTLPGREVFNTYDGREGQTDAAEHNISAVYQRVTSDVCD